jgi:putative effector of murein hydrolase LrgA (UPF0299 family)
MCSFRSNPTLKERLEDHWEDHWRLYLCIPLIYLMFYFGFVIEKLVPLWFSIPTGIIGFITLIILFGEWLQK